jgi:hypothetical protein
MAGKLLVPSEVDAQNIARPNVEQTSAEEQEALAEVKGKIREHFNPRGCSFVTLLMVNFHQASHEFIFVVRMIFISYPLVLTPLV